MKLSIIIILLATLVNNGFAQTKVTDAKNIISDIIAVMGLKANFEVQEGKVDNAAAVNYDAKRYILYNPEFINRLNKAAGNTWASISILAHEIGHHLNGHTLEGGGSRPEIELEADEFSGFVLRRMGATLKEAQVAMRIAADYKQSLTHPGKEDRLVAIAKGWNTANKQQGGKDLAKTERPKFEESKIENDVAITGPRTNDIQTPRRSETSKGNSRSAQLNDAASLTDNVHRTSNKSSEGDRNTASRSSDRSIIADVSFTADNDVSYFITEKFSLVKEMNNQLAKIGRLVKTDSNEYPYIITDDAGTKLWVDSKGNIINKDDKKVGLVRVRG